MGREYIFVTAAAVKPFKISNLRLHACIRAENFFYNITISVQAEILSHLSGQIHEHLI